MLFWVKVSKVTVIFSFSPPLFKMGAHCDTVSCGRGEGGASEAGRGTGEEAGSG
jgi:hypothetical protein